MVSKTFKVPLYNITLKVIKISDWDTLVKKYNLMLEGKLNNDFAGCGAMVFVIKDVIHVAFHEKDIKIQYIAHETTHVVNHICQFIGLSLDVSNDEPQAYLTGWAFDKIFYTLYPNFKP